MCVCVRACAAPRPASATRYAPRAYAVAAIRPVPAPLLPSALPPSTSAVRFGAVRFVRTIRASSAQVSSGSAAELPAMSEEELADKLQELLQVRYMQAAQRSQSSPRTRAPLCPTPALLCHTVLVVARPMAVQ